VDNWYPVARRWLRLESLRSSLSPARRARTERLLAASIVLFIGIFAVRFSVDGPDELILLLCVVPIALTAMALGTLGGLTAATLSYGVFLAWTAIDNVNVGAFNHIVRALSFFFVGGLVGYFTTQGRRLVDQDSRWFELSLDLAGTAGFDGYWKRINPTFEKVLGYSQEELAGRPFLDLVHPADRDDTAEASAKLGAGSDVIGFQNRYRARNGTYHWIEWAATSVVSEGLIYASGKDVTARKQHEATLQEAQERFRTAFEDAPIGMALVGMDGRWLQANDSLCRLTGYSLAHLLKVGFRHITHPDDLAADEERIRQLLDGRIESYRLEKRFIHAEGHPVWVSFHASLVRLPEGPPLYLISQVEDINKRKELEEELRVLAQHDPLTKLFNRQRFAEEFSRQLAHAARYKSCGALFILDLDNFKQVNDSHGHSAGDKLLVTMADILRRNLRITDIPARLGGDEFAILLPEIDMSGAKQVAQKLLAAVRAKLREEADLDAPVTASIGITLVDSTLGSSQDSATIRADHAMYESKRQGGDSFTFYEEVQSLPLQQLSKIPVRRTTPKVTSQNPG
jgi:diguanylate cyclase (GGDEF)-like protein/PAS domain S-box-containing protein